MLPLPGVRLQYSIGTAARSDTRVISERSMLDTFTVSSNVRLS